MPKTRVGGKRVGGYRPRKGAPSAKQLAALRKAQLRSAEVRHQRAITKHLSDNAHLRTDDMHGPGRLGAVPAAKKVPKSKAYRQLEITRAKASAKLIERRNRLDREWVRTGKYPARQSEHMKRIKQQDAAWMITLSGG